MKKIILSLLFAVTTVGIQAQSEKTVEYYIDGETGELVTTTRTPLESVDTTVPQTKTEVVYVETDRRANTIEVISEAVKTLAVVGATVHLLKHGPHFHQHHHHHHVPAFRPVPHHRHHVPAPVRPHRGHRRR